MGNELNNLSKETLIQVVFEKDSQLEQKDSQLEHYAQLVAKLQRMLFGTKSEKFKTEPVDQNQLALSFEELARKSPQAKDEQTVKEKTTCEPKKKKHPGRHKLPDNLPEHVIVIQPQESIEGLVKIGEERTEILEMAPAKFFKLVIIRPKYAKTDEQGVLIGEIPCRPIEKCLAGNALLAHLLIGKYVDHLPLYRLGLIFKRLGMVIPPSTIDGWVRQLGRLLEPLYDAMVNIVKQDGYLQADETPTRVLDKSKKGKCHLGYYWVYHAPLKQMVVFDYQRGRSKDAPRKILDDFHGYLQTDGYAVYNQYDSKKGVTHLACWAHARRYFEQSLTQDKARGEFVMTKIQKLYAIERKVKEFTAQDRKAYRLEKALPIINQLGQFITGENKKVLPKSLIGKAFNYTVKLWDNLQHYLYNGDLHIDNNLIENAIRPNALGRKNYLFAGSDNGAKRTAMFYSFFGTCKINGINPDHWLTCVLENIADHKVNKLHELFPQNFLKKVDM
ncbi:Mobile element protein [hydrothermal vent metagenome]|uniref:Mobile element protein n=1 Tax=hydrothermal vent metagenome TaxID=652676 RepID=A0A3B0VFX7_9ZZZZ